MKSRRMNTASFLVNAGSLVNGQYWFHDTADPFGLGLTQAIEFTVGP